ncbi:MAG TPA: PQQ-binding-like beta-propeller repeat protein, partial [Gemmataceae bacterium]
VSSLCALCASVVRSSPENWPQFRGPEAGVAEGEGLPSEWSTTKNVAWVAEIPGRGWSSPVVWGDRVFLTTVEKEGEFEAAQKGLYFGGERFKPSDEVHRWLVLCLDFHTGKVIWRQKAAEGKPKFAIHIKNSYASETPVTDGERVYAYFGNKGLYVYDLDGNPVWSREFEPKKMRMGWGTAASPVLHGDRLFIVNDNEEDSYLLCLDKKTGKELWKVERDEASNWATPYVWENDKRTELVTNGTKRVRSYDLEGNLLWEMGGNSAITIPTPFARHGLLYVGSGYVLDPRKPLVAVKPGATGDITPKQDGPLGEYIAWRQPKAAPYNPSFLVYGDYLYVLYDRGQLSCFDAKTGKQLYDQERVRGQYTASPWAYGGKVFCLNEDGRTTVVKAGPEFEVLGTNDLDEMCMATPAVAKGSLFIRTLAKLYRITETPAPRPGNAKK